MTSDLLMSGLQLLLDSAVKSVALMLSAWALATALRRASAATRHWVWSAALIGLLALPVLSLALPSWRIGLLPSLKIGNDGVKPAAETEPPVPLVVPTLETAVDAGKQVSATGSSRAIKSEIGPASQVSSGSLSVRLSSGRRLPYRWLGVRWLDETWPVATPSVLSAFERVKSVDWTAAALAFWAVGVVLVIARLASATYRIWRLTKVASLVTQNSWVALAHSLASRLGLRGGVELRKSEQVALPMTWGAWRSVVMLPNGADQWPQECRSIVLLHELAHVKRRDCLTQNLARVACALYWFNPLVWLALRKLHVEREVACDDQVLEVGTKASVYASHLVEIARAFSIGSSGHDLSQAVVGMACSQLDCRVRAILDPGVRRRGLNRLSTSLIGIGAVCLILSLAVVQPWRKASASLAPAEAEGQKESQVFAVQDTPQTSKTEAGRDAAGAEQEPRKTEETLEQEAVQATPETDEQDGSQTKAQSSELTANQLIEMKAAGVTPEFIEEMRKQGFNNLSVGDLTQLSVHGINADYIRQARSWGGDKVTVREIVQLRLTGVTPQYISAMKQAGYDGLTARQLSELRIHGVTPEFVETMRKAGYDKLTANELASLRIHGIGEAFVKEMEGWAGRKPSVSELMQLKIHGVTQEFARRMKAMGFDNLSINKLTELRIHGIDEKYIKEMRDLGFDNLTIDQLITMRVHGVDAEYVKKMRAAGLKNFSVNQMIEMRVTGIDSILLKAR